jgi:SAM-dependent methyltransferase
MSKFDKQIPETVDSRYVGLVDAVHSGWFLQETGELFHGFSVTAEDTLLDVGCGEGAASFFAAQRGAHVIITDTEEKIVQDLRDRITRETPARKVETLVGDSDPLALPDACANRIVCMEVLEHVETPPRLLSELMRVGTPGANYLLSVPGARSEHMQKRTAPASYFQPPNHIHIFEREEFSALVEEAGLLIQEYHQSGFFWVMWMNLYWAAEAAEGHGMDGAIRDKIVPPFDLNLNRWASLWLKMITTAEGKAFKEEMDQILPKNQIILARKPD